MESLLLAVPSALPHAPTCTAIAATFQELVSLQRQRQVSFEQAVLKHSENMKWFGT